MRTPRPFVYSYFHPPDRVQSFDATLLLESEEHLVVTHVVDPRRPMLYRGEEVLGRNYRLVWFLFKHRPFDIGRFYRPDGTWTGYYVDITEPVRWAGADASTLEPVVDLFLDIWIAPDGSSEVLDEDELAEAEAAGWITAAQREHARRTTADLLDQLRQGAFPPPLAVEWDGNLVDKFDTTLSP
jgi:predicted RNA-binding protein associated with RNAse of E/G family